jgi:hypothetical protein
MPLGVFLLTRLQFFELQLAEEMRLRGFQFRQEPTMGGQALNCRLRPIAAVRTVSFQAVDETVPDDRVEQFCSGPLLGREPAEADTLTLLSKS